MSAASATPGVIYHSNGEYSQVPLAFADFEVLLGSGNFANDGLPYIERRGFRWREERVWGSRPSKSDALGGFA